MKDEKIKIGVLMGGKSAEHSVSINSGINVLNAVDKNKYEVKPIIILENGDWICFDKFLEEDQRVDKEFIEKLKKDGEKLSANKACEKLKEEIKVIFIALHGRYGEDGRMQGFLEISEIPHTGSGVLASSLAMDKIKSAEIFKSLGLQVPKYFKIEKREFRGDVEKIKEIIKAEIGFPCVLKPSDDGSSVATFVLDNENNLEEYIRKAFEVSNTLLFQEYIKGDEATCGVLDTEDGPKVLIPTQIIPKSSSFFDFQAKYTKGASDEITPPKFEKEKIEKLQKIAMLSHKSLGCSGLSRTDVIIRDNNFYVLETNTLPGMTETSLFPQGAKAAGISFSELMDILILDGLKRK